MFSDLHLNCCLKVNWTEIFRGHEWIWRQQQEGTFQEIHFLEGSFQCLPQPSFFKVSLPEHPELLVSFLKALSQILSCSQLSERVSFTLDMNQVHLQIELKYGWHDELSVRFLSTPPWIHSDWKPATTRSFEVFWHFPFQFRKRRTNREGEVIQIISTLRKVHLRCGSNVTTDYWQGQGRLSFLWFLIPRDFMHCKLSDDAFTPMFVWTAQCATTIRLDNKESTQKISDFLWNWVTWQYERDRNYV